MKRRDLLTGSLLGITGLFSTTKEYKRGHVENANTTRFIPTKQVKTVYLNGENVTDRCYSFNEKDGVVHLYKHLKNKPYMEYIKDNTPINPQGIAEYAWVDIKGEKTFVQTNPTQIAREIRHGKVVIIEKS